MQQKFDEIIDRFEETMEDEMESLGWNDWIDWWPFGIRRVLGSKRTASLEQPAGQQSEIKTEQKNVGMQQEKEVQEQKGVQSQKAASGQKQKMDVEIKDETQKKV